jgi:hypothetical protein
LSFMFVTAVSTAAGELIKELFSRLSQIFL